MSAQPRAHLVSQGGRTSPIQSENMNATVFLDAQGHYELSSRTGRKFWALLGALSFSVIGIAIFAALAHKTASYSPPPRLLEQDHTEQRRDTLESRRDTTEQRQGSTERSFGSGTMKVHHVDDTETDPLAAFNDLMRKIHPSPGVEHSKKDLESMAVPCGASPSHGPTRKPIDRASSWDLPRLDTVEASLSPRERQGKAFLAGVAQMHEAREHDLSPQAESVLRAVALGITSGLSDQLIGMNISLQNITPFNGSKVGGETLRTFKIVGFLGEGAFKVVLELLAEDSDERLALAVTFAPEDRQSREQPKVNQLIKRQVVSVRLEEAFVHELNTIEAACRGVPADKAADFFGVLAPLFTAQIVGLPNVIAVDEIYVWKRVQVMERLCGVLGQLKRAKKPVPLETKEYISRRLLLQVLLLQESGVSHNDVKWNNMLLRADGSFFLADFGSSSLIGDPMRGDSGISLAYAEPNLVIDFCQSSSGGQPVIPDQKSDMWSLGVLLFNLFTEGGSPYDIKNHMNSTEEAKSYMSSLLRDNVRSSALLGQLESYRVPLRWKQLISMLLEPRRENRISAEEVARGFRDLLRSSPGS